MVKIGDKVRVTLSLFPIMPQEIVKEGVVTHIAPTHHPEMIDFEYNSEWEKGALCHTADGEYWWFYKDGNEACKVEILEPAQEVIQ